MTKQLFDDFKCDIHPRGVCVEILGNRGAAAGQSVRAF